jgi:hypothetical protein
MTPRERLAVWILLALTLTHGFKMLEINRRLIAIERVCPVEARIPEAVQ